MLLVFLSSCRWNQTRTTISNEEIVASYGDAVLWRSELKQVVPPSLKGDDSVQFAHKYMEEWLTEKAVVEEAQKKVPNLEEQVEKDLENIKSALIRKVYNDWLTTQIDTVVNEQDMRSYYDSHLEKFTSNTTYYGYFYVKIKGTQAPQIVSKLNSNNPEEIENLRAWCSENAVNYRLDSSFVEGDALKEISQGYYGDLSHAKMNTVHTYRFTDDKKQVFTNYFRLLKIIKPEEILPYNACKDRIYEAILLQRRNEMIQVSEQAVLKKAQKEGKCVTR